MNTAKIDHTLLQAAVAAMPADKLSASRNAAAMRFAGTGFPDTNQEDWKYTNLSPAAEIANASLRAVNTAAQSTPDVTALDTQATAIRSAINAHWLVIRNGLIEPDHLVQVSANLGSDIRLAQLCDANGLSPAASMDDEPLSLFNAALLRDGLQVRASKSAVAGKPLGIMIIDDGRTRTSQSRLLLDLAENSQLRVVEYSLSAEGGEKFTTAVVEAQLGRGAHLDYVRIQDRDKAHISVNTSRTTLADDARFRHNNFDFGGALTRNTLTASIAGAGADVQLHGLYLASGRQHIDNHTSVTHEVGPATSTEEYRGILNGRARGVFNSKAIVSRGADGTDASQSNHNLLLSDKAEIDTKPELEIYADEVKCSHGATVGQLDESALFYLRSRGLDSAAAARILTGAFAARILDELVLDECRSYLEDRLRNQLETLVNDSNE